MGKLTADDRAEIVELFARYAWAGDTGNLEEFLAIFTPDGVFDGVMDKFKGQEGLTKLLKSMVKGPRSFGIQHLMNNSVFDGDDQRCVVKSMCFAPRRIENEHSIVFVGYYIDTCIKVDNRWLFQVRHWRPWEGEVVRGQQPWLTEVDDDS